MSEHADHRSRIVSVRFRNREWETVRGRALECGMAPSAYLRSIALGAVPKTRPNLANREAIHQLARVGNNLNQLAKRVNSGLPVARGEILEVLAAVRTAVERL